MKSLRERITALETKMAQVEKDQDLASGRRWQVWLALFVMVVTTIWHAIATIVLHS